MGRLHQRLLQEVLALMPNFQLPELNAAELQTMQPIEIGPRQRTETAVEEKLGPLGQGLNAMASPDVWSGALIGPINAVSKLGNAIGDWAQGKKADTSDAWTISKDNAYVRALNPARIGLPVGVPSFDLLRRTQEVYRAGAGLLTGNGPVTAGQEVTAADSAGFDIGAGVAAEGLGALATIGATSALRAAGLLDKLGKMQAVKNVAVQAQRAPNLRRALATGAYFGEGLTSTAAATAFMDNKEGNTFNMLEDFGYKGPNPLAVKASDDYITATGKTILGEGFLLPAAVLGVVLPIGPLRRGSLGDLPSGLQAIAEMELAPYRMNTTPLLPPAVEGPPQRLYAQGVDPDGSIRYDSTPAAAPPEALSAAGKAGAPQLPAKASRSAPTPQPEALPAAGTAGAPQLPAAVARERGGEIVPYDSAISRSIDENLQVQQVSAQRQRLEQMGLVQRGAGNQLELSMGGVIDPEIKLQVRQLQVQRGQLIKAGADQAQLSAIDEQIDNLTMQGASNLQRVPPQQGEFEFEYPGPIDDRPELDTYLAQLDELSDTQLRRALEQANAPLREQRRAQELRQAQQGVQDLEQQLINIEARLSAEGKDKLTPTGAKRLVNKIQKQLDAAQMEVDRLQSAAQDQTQVLIGDQLQLELEGGQLALDLSDETKLPQMENYEFIEQPDGTGTWRRTQTVDDRGGYESAEAYRSDLMGWNRDFLRKFANPTNNPEVAAIVKARTGRRVYQAKKADIVEAFVELAKSRGRFAAKPEVAVQAELAMTMNRAGADAPLFDQPADFSVANTDVEYTPRGMSEEMREQIKKQILEAAVRNGEVQAPVTPLPSRPVFEFDQQSLIDNLLSDDSGQISMLYVNDALPTYKAGGKGADDLLEEMRLRFDYATLDAEAAAAQRQAVLDSVGWDQLTWQEKKATGLIDFSRYRMSGSQLTPEGRLRDVTPEFTPEFSVQGQRAAQPYREWPSTPEFTPELKVQKQRAAQRYRSGPAKAKPPEAPPEPPKKPKVYSYQAGDLVQGNNVQPEKTIKVEAIAQSDGIGMARTTDVQARQKRTFRQQVNAETKEMKLRSEEVELKRKQINDQMNGRSC